MAVVTCRQQPHLEKGFARPIAWFTYLMHDFAKNLLYLIQTNSFVKVSLLHFNSPERKKNTNS